MCVLLGGEAASRAASRRVNRRRAGGAPALLRRVVQVMANLVDADGTAPVDRLVRLLESAVPAATTLGPDASREVKVG